MSDGMALFHSSHSNVGTGGPPSVTTLDEFETLMMAQTGPTGEVLNIRPHLVIAAHGKTSALAVLRGAINGFDPT